VIWCLNSKNNYLYTGIDNPIQLNYKSIHNIHLETNNGIIFTDSLQLITIPVRSGKSRFLLYEISGTDTNLIGYRYITVKNVPEASLKVDSLLIKDGDTVSKNILFNCDSLELHFTSDIKSSKNWFRIYQFSVGYNYGGFYVSHINKSNQLQPETYNLIERIEPGKELSIKLFVESGGLIRKELPVFRIKVY
jgi:hypothetical protein